jgi:hypothetical protein
VLAIPLALDEITPEWLTAAFHHGGLTATSTVSDLTGEMIGEQRGLTGVVLRVQVHWNAPGARPASVIVKLPHLTRAAPSTYRSMLQRDAVAARHAAERFAREARFYREIAPDVPSLVPHCYVALADPATNATVLILEDLGMGRDGDALQGCTIDDARRVVRDMAYFHARWWYAVSASAFSWIPVAGGEPVARQQRYATYAPHFLERHAAQIPDRVRTLVEALVPVFAEVSARSQSAWQTLIHADLHLDNVIFRDDSPDGAVAIIDWQSVSKGLAAVDLSMFVVTSLGPDDRRKAETELLAEYHTVLEEQGVRGYSRDDLLRDYRYGLLRYFGTAVIWLGFVDRSTLAGRELALVDGVIDDGRLVTAVEDHELLSLLPR